MPRKWQYYFNAISPSPTRLLNTVLKSQAIAEAPQFENSMKKKHI